MVKIHNSILLEKIEHLSLQKIEFKGDTQKLLNKKAKLTVVCFFL